MDITLKQAKMKIRSYCDKKFKNKISVSVDESVQPLINGRCHHNAKWAVRSGKAVAVVECVMINSNGTCTAHFINMLEDGRYVDYTLGYEWAGCDYRLSRIITKDFPPAERMLSDFKRMIVNESGLSWLARKLHVRENLDHLL